MISSRLYALQRQFGIVPGGPTEAADPAMTELIEGVTALVTAAIAKKGTQAAPPSARAMAFLRSMQPVVEAAAAYQPPPAARQSRTDLYPIESKVTRRDEVGKILEVTTIAANGRVCTSIPHRDGLGRMISVTHEINGKKAISKIRRDGLGRVVGQTMTLAGQAVTPSVYCDANTATVALLAKVVEENSPSDLSYEASHVPGRNPYGRAFVQRDAAGKIYAVNIGSRQIPVDQISVPTTGTTILFDEEMRQYVNIGKWKMQVTYDREGLVQTLEPMNAED